jgi:serine protease DegS
LIQQMLGLRLQPLTPELAERFLLNSTNGFLIAAVEENAPAAEQLHPGYLVTGIDGQVPDDLVSAAKIVFAKKKGEPVKLDVTVQQRRGGFIYHIPGTIQVPVR